MGGREAVNEAMETEWDCPVMTTDDCEGWAAAGTCKGEARFLSSIPTAPDSWDGGGLCVGAREDASCAARCREGKQESMAQDLFKLSSERLARKAGILVAGTRNRASISAFLVSMTPVWPITNVCKTRDCQPNADKLAHSCACCCCLACMHAGRYKSDV